MCNLSQEMGIELGVQPVLQHFGHLGFVHGRSAISSNGYAIRFVFSRPLRQPQALLGLIEELRITAQFQECLSSCGFYSLGFEAKGLFPAVLFGQRR